MPCGGEATRFATERSSKGSRRFPELGFHVEVLRPVSRTASITASPSQEDFLVVVGECIAIIEGEERRLKAWDFVHCRRGPITCSSAPATGRA